MMVADGAHDLVTETEGEQHQRCPLLDRGEKLVQAIVEAEWQD